MRFSVLRSASILTVLPSLYATSTLYLPGLNLCAEIIFREFKLGTTYIRFLIMRRIYHVFLCAFLIQALSAQELPPVQNYGLLDYAAGNQNWSITQNDDKHLFLEA